ncbi:MULTISPECIES: hypothetical protein [Bacillus cereus group]
MKNLQNSRKEVIAELQKEQETAKKAPAKNEQEKLLKKLNQRHQWS